ncbi:MAG: bacillithiol biosynthesis deacetylase BshB1 [Candidatus Hydrogenedens sp.]|nr:bacillithiol biosynthesis deacetylase BshB1 [Candidatus Hydrogenedens sp.]
MNKIDVLAFGAHPDDVELGIGGTLAKLIKQGLNVGIVDLTRGEMGSRGTVEERLEEAKNSASILGVSIRETLALPDTDIRINKEQKLPLIKIIRKYKPKMILATMPDDRHPDHHNAHFLIREANYFAGVHSINTAQQPYRCPLLLYYYPYYEINTPDFIIDISDYYETKIEALNAYRSQFFNPNYVGPETFISTERFLKSIQDRCLYWGSKINVMYGETLYKKEPIPINLEYLLK